MWVETVTSDPSNTSRTLQLGRHQSIRWRWGPDASQGECQEDRRMIIVLLRPDVLKMVSR